MAKSAYSAEEKYEVVVAYENRQTSVQNFCQEHQISKNTIRKWIYLFQRYGIDGLHDANEWKRYSQEVKGTAVLDYLSRNYSLEEIVRKYEISDISVLRGWIQYYNDNGEIRETRGMKDSMMKGRSTTRQERLEIVLYCLLNKKNYQHTSEHFHVSYQQVYQWVKKYEKAGEEGLKDRRGKHKTETELTPEEKIQHQMKQLEHENERLRAENAFLKKLEELERRRS
jgi:transposase